MDKDRILVLLKARLGISTDRRDTILNAIIDGVVAELENQHGLFLENDADQLMFLVDYAEYRYSKRDEPLPRHLQWRLHNLIVSSK